MSVCTRTLAKSRARARLFNQMHRLPHAMSLRATPCPSACTTPALPRAPRHHTHRSTLRRCHRAVPRLSSLCREHVCRPSRRMQGILPMLSAARNGRRPHQSVRSQQFRGCRRDIDNRRVRPRPCGVTPVDDSICGSSTVVAAAEDVRPPHLDHPAFSSSPPYPTSPAIKTLYSLFGPPAPRASLHLAEGLRSPSYARCHWQPCLR